MKKIKNQHASGSQLPDTLQADRMSADSLAAGAPLSASNPSDVSAIPNTRHLLSSNHSGGNILTSFDSFRAESSVPIMHRFSFF